MGQKNIGVLISAASASGLLDRIQKVERLGIPAAWLVTSGSGGLDALTAFAGAAVCTSRIKLGTCIVPIFPRHPVALVQQVQVIAQLAPGRLRVGLGPGHKSTMEGIFGIEFNAPLGHLREYLRIVKSLLHQGSVDFEGKYYRAHAHIDAPLEVPVMASALRRKSFQLCGEEADGAISWMCPGPYLRDVATPAMRAGAEQARRAVPPLIAHAPVCVHEDANEVYAAFRQQSAHPRLPFYQRMFADAGFPEASDGHWSDRMIEATVLYGNEEKVAAKLYELFAFGATEVLVNLVSAGENRAASVDRALRVVAEVARGTS